MKNIILLIVITILHLQTEVIAQENSFPLYIGNKWYYLVESNISGFYYGCTKEITDTLSNGFKEVTVRYYYKDTIKSGIENWTYVDGKFFINGSSPSNIYFDDNLSNDTCWSLWQTKCWEIMNYQLFNILGTAQKSTEYNNVQGVWRYSKTLLPKIGIVEDYYYGMSVWDSIPHEYTMKLKGMNKNGMVLGDTVLNESTSINDKNTIKRFSLSQNYPNPFNPTTKIEYSIPKTLFVSINVYDVLGREVAALVSEEKSVGKYTVEFNGSGLSSGMYFYKIQAKKNSSVKKMVLIK